MSSLSTTKLSSKGQVVIPEEIRKQLQLQTGDQFIVIAEGDVVILKTLNPPSIRDFDSMIAKARKQAKGTKLSKNAIEKAIKDVRQK